MIILKSLLSTRAKHVAYFEFRHGATDKLSRITLSMILSAENNCLVALPNDIGNLSSIQQANFNNNQLQYIPPTINGCGDLRILGGLKRSTDFVFN